MIEDFQNYVGKRVQRFHPKTPNICCYYGLGWMRLERIIQIRKLMFIRSILAMEDNAVAKQVFCERASFYFENIQIGSANICRSVVFDLLNVCVIFNVLTEVQNMVLRNHLYSKAAWKGIVWKRGWELEDVHWQIEKQLYRNLDLLQEVSEECRYNTWRKLSDKDPSFTKKCEVMVKIASHASMLKSDDFKLKRCDNVTKMCDLCDGFVLEDAAHFVLQCGYFQQQRDDLMLKLANIERRTGVSVVGQDRNLLHILLGKQIIGAPVEHMEAIWITSLNAIYEMYLLNTRIKKGIG